MNIRYIIFATVLLIGGAGLFLIPIKDKTNEVQPKELMTALFDQTRYISTDEIAERLINEDPSLFLIDVRMADYYYEFSLAGAANVPLEEILSPDFAEYLEQEYMDIVFYSTGDIFAEQAWMMASRAGYENLYIMKGGLNEWFSTIILPQKPADTEPEEAFALYAFRKGASQYFGGGGLIETETDNLQPVVVKRKKKEAVVEGGC